MTRREGSAIHPNAELIERFYAAFSAGDHETMAACYAPSVTFDDPVFHNLDYEHATAMWRMFCMRDNDVTVTATDAVAGDRRGSAHWEALYVFPSTGRRVHNKIDAEFEFEDGLVVRHRDHFDFYRWTRMALGPPGLVLGWTPMMRAKVRKMARAQLERFMKGAESGGRPPH